MLPCRFAARHFCRWPSCCRENESVTTSIQASCKCPSPVRKKSYFFFHWNMLTDHKISYFHSSHRRSVLFSLHVEPGRDPTDGRMDFFRLGNGIPSDGCSQCQLDDDQSQQGLSGSALFWVVRSISRGGWSKSIKGGDDRVSTQLCLFLWSDWFAAVRHLSSMPLCTDFGVDHRLGGQRQFPQQRPSSRFDLFT